MKNNFENFIEKCHKRGDFVKDVDGFTYWWPESYKDGHFSSELLRELADELDRLNKSWQDYIDKNLN